MKKKMMVLSALLMTTACWAGRPLSVNIGVSQADCIGGVDGAIFVTVTGGKPALDFRVTVNSRLIPDPIVQTGRGPFNFFNLPAGKYTVKVEQRKSKVKQRKCRPVCKKVTVPESDLFVTVVVVPDQCQEDVGGSINVMVSGGEPDFTVEVSNQDFQQKQPGMQTKRSFNFTNLAAGEYAVRVTDRFFCERILAVEVPMSDLKIDQIKVVLTGSGGCDLPGTITVTVTGGEKPFTVDVTGPKGFQDSDNGDGPDFTFNIVDPGQYQITVTDDAGCKRFDSVTVEALSFTTLVTPENCEPDELGSIEVTVSGGFPPYALFLDGTQIDEGNGPFIIPDLEASTYTVLVVDKNGCTEEKKVLVPFNNLACTVTATPQSFEQETGGTITVNVTGVTGGIRSFAMVKSETVEQTKTSTQQNPTFVFDNLSPDRYVVMVITVEQGVVPCPPEPKCVVVLSNNPILNFTNVKYCGDAC